MRLPLELPQEGRFPEKRQGRGKRPHTSRGMRILEMRQDRADGRRGKLLAIMSTSWSRGKLLAMMSTSWEMAGQVRAVPGALRENRQGSRDRQRKPARNADSRGSSRKKTALCQMEKISQAWIAESRILALRKARQKLFFCRSRMILWRKQIVLRKTGIREPWKIRRGKETVLAAGMPIASL